MLEARRSSQIDFAPDGTPIIVGNSNAGGLPLFSIIQVPLNSERLGFLSLAKDNGLLSGDVFVDAYNELVKLSLTGNEPNIITMAEYEAEILAEGKCDKFGLNIVNKQFKIPFTPSVNYQIKLYGTLTNKNQVNMVDVVTQLTSKLDIDTYSSESWSKAKALARIAASGDILISKNITSVTVDDGTATIYSPFFTADAIVVAKTLGNLDSRACGINIRTCANGSLHCSFNYLDTGDEISTRKEFMLVVF